MSNSLRLITFRWFLLSFVGLALIPTAHGQVPSWLNPFADEAPKKNPSREMPNVKNASKTCMRLVYSWMNENISGATRKEMAVYFCENSRAVESQITDCLDDAYDWMSDLPESRRLQYAFNTCKHVVQAWIPKKIVLFNRNSKTRASQCLAKNWEKAIGQEEGQRYFLSSMECQAELALLPREELPLAPMTQEPAQREIPVEDSQLQRNEERGVSPKMEERPAPPVDDDTFAPPN